MFFDALTPKEQRLFRHPDQIALRRPRSVLYPGYYPEAGLLLRQKKEMGWDVPMMGGDSVNNADLVKIAGLSSCEGFLFFSPPVPADLTTEQGKAFMAAYTKAYETLPNSVWALLAGDAFNVLVEALRHTDGSSDAMAEYLKTGLKDYTGYRHLLLQRQGRPRGRSVPALPGHRRGRIQGQKISPAYASSGPAPHPRRGTRCSRPPL